jgi:hypothetical protein
MAQQVQTSMMAGGLDLVTPPISMPPGKAISAINYEPDVSGYTSMGGYERFDGRTRPSESTDPIEITALRGAIQAPPGTGPVRGVWVFQGAIYAFRDQDGSNAAMFRSSSSGWQQMVFGQILEFSSGEAQFTVGEYIEGATANAIIDRIVTRGGDYAAPPGNTASGFLILSSITGTFVPGETITSPSGGEALAASVPATITLFAGGRYEFINHNFYGAASRERMYFVNGVNTAFEWDGEVLAPIQTGISAGLNPAVVGVYSPVSVAPHTTESPIYTPAVVSPVVPEYQIIVSAQFDSPAFIAQYKNHLFLGYTSGTILFSSLGEPLEYNTGTGAGEISFGQPITGLLEAASTSLVIFASNRCEYMTGDNADTFIVNPLTDASGAQPYSIQMMDEPMFLDDGGVRKLSATAAFGDWRMGSVTAPIETLIRQKRDSGVSVVASQRIKGKDQYRLFWSDTTGITVYVGRKHPETMPFKVSMQVFCACNGEVEQGRGERLFVGAQDGFVYEMNRGTSYDGAEIESYIRLPFNSAGSPSQHTRWMKATFELSTPDPITIGVAFDVDYARGLGGAETQVPVEAGSAIISTNCFPFVDWTPVEARLEYHLQGIGPNIAATLVHNSAVARQHTISSQTYNFSRRRMMR